MAASAAVDLVWSLMRTARVTQARHRDQPSSEAHPPGLGPARPTWSGGPPSLQGRWAEIQCQTAVS